MSAVGVPAFDPDSPDADLLEAFDNIRSNKAWIYRFDDATMTPEQEAAIDASDTIQLEDERRVLATKASTPAGIFCKLALALTMQTDRWVDSDFAEHGFQAIYPRRGEMDGRDAILVDAMFDLLVMEFEQNLAAYNRSADLFSLALGIKSVVEAEVFRLRSIGAEQPAFLAEMHTLATRFEDDAANIGEITRLYRTLTPTTLALQTKLQVMLNEDEDGPTEWIARDVKYLSGALRAEQAGEPA